jgi:hypothetical protein
MVDRRGYPTGQHPESLTADLPEADEVALAELAGVLWPEGEYTGLIDEHSRRIGGQQ